MTYRCGLDAGVAALCNDVAGPPRITCDSCGLVHEIVARGAGGVPPLWLVEDRAPRGWAARRDPGGELRHYCPACKARFRVNKARRGTKGNPFDVGERVRFRGTQALGVVVKRSGVGTGGGSWTGDREWHPVLYLVRSEATQSEAWHTSRALQAYP